MTLHVTAAGLLEILSTAYSGLLLAFLVASIGYIRRATVHNERVRDRLTTLEWSLEATRAEAFERTRQVGTQMAGLAALVERIERIERLEPPTEQSSRGITLRDSV